MSDRRAWTAEEVRLRERLETLEAQVQFLVDYMNEADLLDDNCFTFPDGETIYATPTEEPKFFRTFPYGYVIPKTDEDIPDGYMLFVSDGKPVRLIKIEEDNDV